MCQGSLGTRYLAVASSASHLESSFRNTEQTCGTDGIGAQNPARRVTWQFTSPQYNAILNQFAGFAEIAEAEAFVKNKLLIGEGIVYLGDVLLSSENVPLIVQ